MSSNLNAGDTIVPEIVRENLGKDIIDSEIENLNEGELDLIIGGNLEEENNIEITPDHTKTLNSEEHLDEGFLDSNIEANLEENLNPEEIKKEPKESKMSKSDDELKQLAKAYLKAIKANNNDQQDEIYSELNEEAKRFWKILEPLIDKDEQLKTLRDKIAIETKPEGTDKLETKEPGTSYKLNPTAPQGPINSGQVYRQNEEAQRINLIKRFPKNSPRFGGRTNEAFDTWKWSIRQCIRIEQMNDQEAILALVTNLEGTPLHMYKTYIDENASNYRADNFDEFLMKLDKIYSNTRQIDRWLEKMNSLKRKQFNSLEDYIETFMDLTSKLNQIRKK